MTVLEQMLEQTGSVVILGHVRHKVSSAEFVQM